MEYSLVWFTNGYQPTKKSVRNELRISFKFTDGELVFPVQAKFYPFSDTTHLTWGTPLRAIELDSAGNFQQGASSYQNFSIRKTTFK